MAQQFGEARGTINRFVSAAAKIISPIWWISFLSALHVLLFFSFAAAQELFYGTEVHLQNKYSQWGSFLDTNGAGCQGAEACVSAASCPDRTTEKTGIWRFLPATTPLRVAPVLYGDEVYIQNAFNGGSAYLDTNGHGCQDNLYCVSGSRQRDRAGVGTGVWRIVSASGKPDGTPVQLGDEFHVQNKYSNWGSYLDTNQRGCQGNRYCVSASERPDRAGAGTGIWRAVAAGTATGSPDDRDAPLSVPIRNLPTLLTKDSNQLSKGKSLDTFLGTAFMDAYRPRESTNTHAQGITITGDGRIVFNYSLNGSGGAPIIWTDKITPDNRTAIRSSFETKFQNYHPSAMQAAGNIVAVTDNDDEGGFGDVRFLYLEPEGNWSELSHLKLAGRKYNGLGFIRHMDGYYYMIGEKTATHSLATKTIDLWRSNSSSGIFCGGRKMELLKTFTLEENVIPIATSASNTHLLSKSATELWVVALYSPDGDPNEHVSLSILNLDQNRMIRVLDWNLGQFWAGTVKTLRPSARWAAGISVVEGIPVLIYGQRSVLGINSRYSFGFVLLGN